MDDIGFNQLQRFDAIPPQTLIRAKDREWWRDAVVGHIYLRSFADSNGDGEGDLRGLINNVGYLRDLGLNAAWLSPCNKSPRGDGFYDFASYDLIDPLFGTNDDLAEAIDVLHRNEINVIRDLAVNHTSSEHPWFLRALQPDMHARRVSCNYTPVTDKEWGAFMYVFHPGDPKNPDRPPNDWICFFGPAPAWTRVETGEWVLSRFTPQTKHTPHYQPDLNPYNPLVTKAIVAIVQRWLRQGIDGIRLDVIDHCFHDPLFRDFNLRQGEQAGWHLDGQNWQERWLLRDALELAKTISRAIRGTNPGAMSYGELHWGDLVADYRHLASYIEEGEIDAPFNFSLKVAIDKYGADAEKIKETVEKYLQAIRPYKGCPNFPVSNHDQEMRFVDWVGVENVRAMAMMLLTLGDIGGSNPIVYMGDEIGATAYRDSNKGEMILNDPALVVDPQGHFRGVDHTRDHSRLLHCWDPNLPNGGFSTGPRVWIPAGRTVYGTGAEQQRNDPNSLFSLYKNIICQRAEHAALRFGAYVPHDSDKGVFCYGRRVDGMPGGNMIVALNFSGEPKDVASPDSGRVLLSTEPTRDQLRCTGHVRLQPREGCIIQLANE